MSTLMQKDVLIELISTVQARLSQSYKKQNVNDDLTYLVELRHLVYQSQPQDLDYSLLSHSIQCIASKYNLLNKLNIDANILNYDVDIDVDKKFPLVWDNLLAGNYISSQEYPIATLLGGQPGSGKSYGSKLMLERLNNNVLVINGDEFRPYHQYFDEIYAKYGKDFSKYTGEFAGKMVEKIRDEAIKQRFNIVIEGTFRRAELPLKELINFERKGYKTGVIICTCSSKTSWHSTIERAEEQQAQGLNPRYVPKEHHDLVVSKLAENVSSVVEKGSLSFFEIYSRESKQFDLQTGNTSLIKDVITKILAAKI
ncbi:zeta toxin family protein [Glaesserella parasuis]|uniref:zeta toxin family protein n=1 Tax=Glaesserella parasuis TaxID=738 RepID=UPI001F187F4E|nr:zeta toxin family protein [Glaesserella parasuis]